MSRPAPSPGALVAWWSSSELRLGVVAEERGGRVRLIGEGGRQDRVPAARIALTVEPSGRAPGPSHEERQAAARRVEACADNVRAAAAACDVALLWELTVEQPQAYATGALAELALGSGAAAQRAALILALLDDGIRFVRKGEDWEPRDAEQVAALLEQHRRTAARAQARRRVLDGVAAAVAGRGFTPSDSATERRYLGALRELAIEDLDATEKARALAIEALDASGLSYDRPHEGAFRLLRLLGEFDSDDENLDLLRYGVRGEFPAAVVEHARAAALRAPAGDGRLELSGLDTVTIDSPYTREIDDGLSLEPLDGGRARIGIHIADPGAYIEPGDPLDVEALGRGLSHYLPDRKLPMLPPSISEAAASLVAGQERPAVSFLVELDERGEIAGWEVARSQVRCRARLSYEELDDVMRDGGAASEPGIARLVELLLRREQGRIASGAVRIVADEVEPRVGADGTVVLERHPGGSPSRRAVGEAMVLAGTIAARFCVERELPAIYRRQAPPERPLKLPEADGWDPASVRAVRRSMRRGEIGLQPGEHFALGLPAYIQATSPLRRYQDLAIHRQITAALRGAPPPHDAEALQRIAATTEQAERVARRIERAADRYWLLRYLEQQRPGAVDAVVVALEPRPVVELRETLLEQVVPSLQGVEPGQSIELRVERVNPRADVLVLRP